MTEVFMPASDRLATVHDVQSAVLTALAAGLQASKYPGVGGAGSSVPGAPRVADPGIHLLLERWRRWLTDHEHDTPKHVREVVAKVRRVARDLGVAHAAGLDSANVGRWFEEFAGRGGRRGHLTLSHRTKNHYLVQLRAFLAYCRKHQGLAWLDRLEELTLWRPAEDERHVRREISAVEVEKLVAAAECGPTIETVSGPDRAVLYVVACWTGLRKQELGSLTAASFDLGAPAVRVAAKHAKNRKARTVPLHPAVAAAVERWLAARGPHAGELLWPISGLVAGGKERKAHKMIARDLAAAGVAYRTDVGVADLHACRHTFVSRLARAGVPVRVAQELAGHSDPALTLRIYTHVATVDQTAAVNALPAPPAASPTPQPSAFDGSNPTQDYGGRAPPRPSEAPEPAESPG